MCANEDCPPTPAPPPERSRLSDVSSTLEAASEAAGLTVVKQAEPDSSSDVRTPRRAPPNAQLKPRPSSGSAVQSPLVTRHVTRCSPSERLAWTFRVSAVVDKDARAETEFYHEGADRLALKELKSQLALLPSLKDLSPSAVPVDADDSEPGESTP